MNERRIVEAALPAGMVRCLVDKRRVEEMRRHGWRVVDTLADADDGEWAALMEGPELPENPPVSLDAAASALLRKIVADPTAARSPFVDVANRKRRHSNGKP